MAHPGRAARDPLKRATLAARQSRFCGVMGFRDALRGFFRTYFAKRFLVSTRAIQKATTA